MTFNFGKETLLLNSPNISPRQHIQHNSLDETNLALSQIKPLLYYFFFPFLILYLQVTAMIDMKYFV